MPYCSSCGKQVNSTDRFCASCGAAQPGVGTAWTPPGTGGSAWQNSAFQNTSPRTASILCYVPFVGWIASLLVLAAERFRRERTVRFHAFQGLYLFVVWLLVDLVGDSVLAGGGRSVRWMIHPLKLAVLGTWIYMIIQTNQDKLVRLPLLGELADRSVDEQK
jgi:uncharacterized membrane protein